MSRDGILSACRMIAVSLAAAALLAGAAATAGAEEPVWRHATSLIDAPKYPPDFRRFDYVNPDAPKGGLVRFSDNGSFDSLNIVPPKGSIATGIGLVYDTLMADSMDEVSTMYGLLAEALRFPDDYTSVTYRLREGAKWHDGVPVTPEDVVFSFEVQTRHNPQRAFYYRHVTKAEKTGPREVTFTFDEKGNRELPHIVGQLVVLPKHWWDGTDASGNRRDITRSGLEVPLGSGPYRVKTVIPGRSISFERVSDYWGKDLPVNVGANNIGEIRYEFFRDDTVELEAFKADQVDWRIESTARLWATAYDFPAVADGRVKRATFEQPYRASGALVGFVFNLSRDPFGDVRVRQAFDLVLPFEEMNKTLFYGQYQRIGSYFHGLPLAASGLPEGRELEILNEVKDKVPASVFTAPYANPVNDTPAAARENLRRALALLKEAGYELKGNALVAAKTGQPLKLEYLLNGPAFEKVALAFQRELKKIGIELAIRVVDSAQYENRVRARDFDLIYAGWGQSMSPGNEQLEYFGSESARREGSQNFGGIADPAVDGIIQKILFASDRADLVAATRALDRVLLANHYVVPGWTLRAARVAYWDRFAHPEPLPAYQIGFPAIWWYDEAKAAKVGRPPQ